MTKTFEKLFYVSMITLGLGSLAEASSTGGGELYREARIESMGYATYTPAMAERGQRFYVGQ